MFILCCCCWCRGCRCFWLRFHHPFGRMYMQASMRESCVILNSIKYRHTDRFLSMCKRVFAIRSLCAFALDICVGEWHTYPSAKAWNRTNCVVYISFAARYSTRNCVTPKKEYSFLFRCVYHSPYRLHTLLLFFFFFRSCLRERTNCAISLL